MVSIVSMEYNFLYSTFWTTGMFFQSSFFHMRCPPENVQVQPGQAVSQNTKSGGQDVETDFVMPITSELVCSVPTAPSY